MSCKYQPSWPVSFVAPASSPAASALNYTFFVSTYPATESFPAGAESFCAVIGIGTKQNGTIGVRDFKIEAAIKQLIDGGDQPFTVRLVHDDGDETSRALAEVTAPPSAYLQALQHASESETDVEASCDNNGFVVRDGQVCGF